MQMSLHDYDNITLAQFINKMAGFFEHSNRLEEQAWKRSAYLAYSIIMNNPYVKKHEKPKTFEAFLNKGKPNKIRITSEAALKKFFGHE